MIVTSSGCSCVDGLGAAQSSNHWRSCKVRGKMGESGMDDLGNKYAPPKTLEAPNFASFKSYNQTLKGKLLEISPLTNYHQIKVKYLS